MIFHPQNMIETGEFFELSEKVCAKANKCLQKEIIKEFWHNFAYECSELNLCECEEYSFSIGNTEKLPLEGFDYSIHVNQEGVNVYAKSEKNLIQGFMTLLDQLKIKDSEEEMIVGFTGCQIKDRALIQNRMVHFCIFPETKLWELQRFVRLCGALKYTHIILEFWGALQYDCLKELSWNLAYTKDEIRPIIEEAHDLGLEIIPMFNHWGHASAGRVMYGKHVVLDQNPKLQTYFNEDGWCWDLRKAKVRKLLSQIREELMELCGEGQYFHIGCDEAYSFECTKENLEFICQYINEVSDEMRSHGRRIIVWGDMFLYNHPDYNSSNTYSCGAKTEEMEDFLFEHLSTEVVIADWQYVASNAPVETALLIQKKGFDCLLCSWDRGAAVINAILSTVKEHSLLGMIHTTWHTLSGGMPNVTMAGMGGYEDTKACETSWSLMQTKTAALMRKVMPCQGDYEKAGWNERQIG